MKITDSMSKAQRTTSNLQTVELHIEELVLDGFVASHRYAVGDAVEQEVARLFRENGLPISLLSENATDEVKGGSFNRAENSKPSAIGRQIAEAVYRGFGE